ncbi:MAG: multi-sensor hybrid histidine kinase, partial [Deltaproteobacteria bacterium]|nr:multi-sensor hybrid histidine kinase [Deltaproteobacteria bacterium]
RFFSLALDLLAIANTDGYFQRLNQAWENVLGYPIEELQGRRFFDFLHPEDLSATLEAVADLSRGKEVINFTNRYRCRDGSYRWIEWRSAPYQNKLIYAAARLRLHP